MGLIQYFPLLHLLEVVVVLLDKHRPLMMEIMVVVVAVQ